MITEELVASRILAYLNGKITLNSLLSWVEGAIVIFIEEGSSAENSQAVWDVLYYLNMADKKEYPLTWEVIKDFLSRLHRPIKEVIA